MKEGMGQPTRRFLTATDKVWRVEQFNILICSGYNSPDSFLKSTKDVFSVWCLKLHFSQQYTTCI